MAFAQPSFGRRKPLQPAAPLTPELDAVRPRAMMWCGLGIVMLLTNMTLRGRPMLAVITLLVAARAFWLLYRYLRAQFRNDIAFWTPARAAAWEAGERDMAAIANIVDAPPPPLPLAPPPKLTPAQDESEATASLPAPTNGCCCAASQAGGLAL